MLPSNDLLLRRRIRGRRFCARRLSWRAGRRRGIGGNNVDDEGGEAGRRHAHASQRRLHSVCQPRAGEHAAIVEGEVNSGVLRRSSPLTGKPSSSCCSCLAALIGCEGCQARYIGSEPHAICRTYRTCSAAGR
eukprot:2992371-Prymnesium_polylepis.1